MTTAAVGLFEAKTRLSEYVARAEAGEEVIIMRHNKPVAKIVPLHAKGEPERVDIPPFIQRTHDMGVPKVDLRQLNKLLGEMDVEEFLKLQARLEAERQQREP
ncbi:type II toxin-antitoxin system prevent-host-death family antitoxin [Ottowia sp. SB7-C50]|uniref:type II toxin-antitoxin system Phd/YefM family antitoxin n=1 Tax=Ottowia sp. SB7-C50 TaxID=3081231 RepID=UPI00295539C6|nr:type II toxin-antitoxin system prevent-host-death family antitoxin [Ottowia sp. SB7-C50]WOP14177.1 type II toxin-antitoxin system prevent-host-death family antitoxin [Ottowia sp. SB7-C50]